MQWPCPQRREDCTKTQRHMGKEACRDRGRNRRNCKERNVKKCQQTQQLREGGEVSFKASERWPNYYPSHSSFPSLLPSSPIPSLLCLFLCQSLFLSVSFPVSLSSKVSCCSECPHIWFLTRNYLELLADPLISKSWVLGFKHPVLCCAGDQTQGYVHARQGL